jgi:hypothetical protein
VRGPSPPWHWRGRADRAVAMDAAPGRNGR